MSIQNEAVFLAKTSSPLKPSSLPSSPNKSPTKFQSSQPSTPITYSAESMKSPLQQYKESRASDEKFKSRPSLDRIKSQKMLTESMIKRKKEEKEAHLIATMAAKKKSENDSSLTQALTIDTSEDSPWKSFGGSESDNDRSYDEIVEDMGARVSRGSDRKINCEQDKSVSAETTMRPQPPLAKAESGEYSMNDLKEDLYRMNSTIQTLKDSNMRMAQERKFAEKIYKDEIMKLKVTLKVASDQINAEKEKVETLTTQLAQVNNPKISPKPSEQSSFKKPAKLMSSASKSNHDSSPQIMVSVSTDGGGGSSVSAADCAKVSIDDIKSKLLQKFGWTEIEELESERDEMFTMRLYEEIQILKSENQKLHEKLKTGNIDTSDIEKQSPQRPALASTPSKRRVFAQPGSASSLLRRATVGTPTRRNIKDECSGVSVSSLKDKFLQDL